MATTWLKIDISWKFKYHSTEWIKSNRMIQNLYVCFYTLGSYSQKSEKIPENGKRVDVCPWRSAMSWFLSALANGNVPVNHWPEWNCFCLPQTSSTNFGFVIKIGLIFCLGVSRGSASSTQRWEENPVDCYTNALQMSDFGETFYKIKKNWGKIN